MSEFRLGDHEFLDPSGPPAPLSRLTQQPRQPIARANPPTFVERFVAEPLQDGPAAALLDGSFCGHGEPTFTVYDLVLAGQRDIELAVPYAEGDEPTLRLRRAGSDEPWQILVSLKEHFEFLPEATGQGPQPISDEAGNVMPVRAAIGFEYPCDATSVDDVSWVSVAIQYGPDKQRGIVFSMETA